jgi:hypothetical protein
MTILFLILLGLAVSFVAACAFGAMVDSPDDDELEAERMAQYAEEIRRFHEMKND